MPNDDDSQFQTGNPEVVREAVAFSRALRRFLDCSASAKPDTESTTRLVGDLERWSERLDERAAPEAQSLWRKARRDQPPALLPALGFVEDGAKLEGNVTFGRFHVGRGAAHGGAIGLVFDEIMGALAGSGQRKRARTAYLHVDFRALVPIDKELRIHAWFEAEDGRKRFLRGTIADRELVCAEARGLWIELRPGQP